MAKSKEDKNKRKDTSLFLWLMTSTLSALVMFAGVSKIIDTGGVYLETWPDVGIPAFVIPIIGVFEMLIGLALLLRRVTSPVAIVLSVYLLFALSVWFSTGLLGGVGPTVALLVFTGLVALFRWSDFDTWLSGSNKSEPLASRY